MAKILVVERDPQQGRALEKSLHESGWASEWLRSGQDAVERVDVDAYDLILLGSTLPDGEGVGTCRKLRAAGFRAPVVVVTASTDVAAKIEAFDSGADDCLAKPYDARELLARVHAHARRWRDMAAKALKNTRITLTFRPPEVKVDGQRLPLTQVEFALLAHLMQHAPRTISRSSIRAAVWGKNAADNAMSNVVDVHIAHLREKLGSAGKQIQTVRGIGYRMNDGAEEGIPSNA